MNIIKERKTLSKQYRRERLANETHYEYLFRTMYLKNIKFIREKIIFVDEYLFYILDFYIPKYKLAIEIDGIQHKSNKDYDNLRTKRLKSVGIRKVLRFTNYEIKNMDPERIKQLIKISMLS
jgi:very-short-patch-repair endonuclease